MTRRCKPSRAHLMRVIIATARAMEAIGKTTAPMSRDLRRFFEQQSAWMLEQLRTRR